MANDLTKNPLRVDTSATTVTFAGQGILDVKEVLWLGATTDTHTLVLTINGAAMTFTHTAAVDSKNKSLFAQPLGRVESFVVTTIDSGVCWIVCN